MVALLPMGSPDTKIPFIIADNIENFFGFKTLIMKTSEMPSIAWYTPRSRYRADTLLDYLIRVKPDSCQYIMGITDKDISCTNGPYEDWGIFGYGYMPGPSCVVSTFRLARNAHSDEHFHERVIKVALHELGHNLGLPHCPTPGCLMQDAEGTIVTVDNEKIELCDKCRKLLGI